MAENKTTRRFIRSLDRAFKVDQAINYATKDFVIIRFGDAADKVCKEIDEWIEEDAAGVNKFARIYKVENNGVPELVTRYSLSDNCSIIFFYEGTVGYRLPTANIKEERRQKDKKFRELAYDICENIRKAKKQRPGDWLMNFSESYIFCNPHLPSMNSRFGNPFLPSVGENSRFGNPLVPSVGQNSRFGKRVPPFGNPVVHFGNHVVPSAGENLRFGNHVVPSVGENLRFGNHVVPSVGENLRFGNTVVPFANPVVPSVGENLRFGNPVVLPSVGQNLRFGDPLDPISSESLGCLYPYLGPHRVHEHHG